MSRRPPSILNQQHQLEDEPSRSLRSSLYRGLISLSRDETILLSSCGDVVTCRCRDSPYPPSTRQIGENRAWQGGLHHQWQLTADQVANLCCETDCEDITQQLQGAALCGGWGPLQGHEEEHVFTVESSRRRDERITKHSPRSSRRLGLLGGNPADVAVPVLQHPSSPLEGLQGGGSCFRDSSDPTFQEQAAVAFRSPPLRTTGRLHPLENDPAMDEDASSIVPIRSFDYSHFYADPNGNDMLPDTPRRGVSATSILRSPDRIQADAISPSAQPSSPGAIVASRLPAATSDSYFHGIPTFMRSFSQIRIRQVSAHPLGSHVLLISNSGLLYSYGLNDFGQLGIGVRSSSSSAARPHCGPYVSLPTIITPLLENGGKAIRCAAGVNHSLVVVETEERRIVKTRSLDPMPTNESALSSAASVSSRSLDPGRSTRKTSTETIVHHQVYGFGRNDSMKIGLISPRAPLAAVNGMVEGEVESVVLPRRVALRCRVQQIHDEGPVPGVMADSLPPLGIFDIQASAEHSAALVHRGTGQIELYTWGNATFGALGCGIPPVQTMTTTAATTSVVPVNVVPVPSFVASLSLSDNAEAQASSLLMEGEFPSSCSLGRRSSFLLTSLGRCFAFGTSEEGMLGLGPKISESSRPSEIALPVELRGERLTLVSAGLSHVLACTQRGHVLAWGSKIPSGLDLRSEPAGNSGTSKNNAVKIARGNNPTHDDHIQWSPRQVELPSSSVARQDCKVVSVGAGYDCSLFVTESGRVLSCGLSSGRLGLGEAVGASPPGDRNDDGSEDDKATILRRRVATPRPLWGGFRLWYDRPNRSSDANASVQQRRRPPNLPVIHRGVTIS